MNNNKPKANRTLNNYYNNIHIPIELLVLLEASKELKSKYGPTMLEIVQDAEAAVVRAQTPN